MSILTRMLYTGAKPPDPCSPGFATAQYVTADVIPEIGFGILRTGTRLEAPSRNSEPEALGWRGAICPSCRLDRDPKR